MGMDSVNYSYLGYKHGCDTIAVGVGSNWFDLSGLEFGFDALFTAHGSHGIDYRGDGSQISHILTGKEHYNDVAPTSNVEKGLVPEYRLKCISPGLHRSWCFWNVGFCQCVESFQQAGSFIHRFSVVNCFQG